MNKFILLTLLAVVASRNIVLVGDSRFVGMACYVMGFSYYSTITSGSSRSYNGDNFHVTAKEGASATAFRSGSNLYNSIVNQIKSFSSPKVVFWLGINDLSSVESTIQLYSSLARAHPSASFYAISVLGVNESKVPQIRNSNVHSFNNKISSKISGLGLSNLKYRSIVNGNDVTTIIVGGKKVSVLGYSSDGLHYSASGYREIWSAMSQKI